MVSRRSYGSYNDGCAAAHALDLIGERWALIVVRELLLGPKRFSDIQRDVLGIGPAVLTQRLSDLEAHGVASRRRLPGPGRADVYELTEWGYRLEAVNTALSMWAVASPSLPLDADMSPDTIVLAMRAHARPVPGPTPEESVALALTDSRRQDADPVAYTARMSAAGTTIVRTAQPAAADAEVVASTHDWKACLIGGVGLADLPGVAVSGSSATVDRLIEATKLHGPAGDVLSTGR
ncbi:winged helix-turn-helix transcriptional regulator [Zhihengliuella halotolerans]|uniref:HxlR family transcriptional regulator n=1 Tax=Zhihengliuella halotolerans TaxID=370736 RepID=A0A4Q8AB43_9MICC|nr:helix-turn-helix domain-containing protein [Zhihengliuella halotolerans]RZU60785.1 HxlR family transcriptional regulator [Zhihengliuella halotolerans]